MSKQIYCSKLKQEAEGLDTQPFPGPLGEKVFQSISKKAWGMWLAHQTMLINEYRLRSVDAEARIFLRNEMEKFLFGEGAEKPQGYTPPEKS